MNTLLFGAVGALCLLTNIFVAVSTGHDFIIYRAEAVAGVVPVNVYTPKHYLAERMLINEISNAASPPASEGEERQGARRPHTEKRNNRVSRAKPPRSDGELSSR